MQLILVRHGRPAEGHAIYPDDPPLDELGQRQSQAAARWLAKEAITHIVSSPMRRAMETAEPLVERTGLTMRVMDGWAEADKHSSRYRSMETLKALGGDEWRRFLNDPIRYLGGDPHSFQRSVMLALSETLELSPQGRVVVFTHGMPINVVLSSILGLESLTRFAPGHASLTRLQGLSLPRLAVLSVNELTHREASDS